MDTDGFPSVWMQGIRLANQVSKSAVEAEVLDSGRIRARMEEVYEDNGARLRNVVVKWGHGVDDKITLPGAITVNF